MIIKTIKDYSLLEYLEHVPGRTATYIRSTNHISHNVMLYIYIYIYMYVAVKLLNNPNSGTWLQIKARLRVHYII